MGRSSSQFAFEQQLLIGGEKWTRHCSLSCRLCRLRSNKTLGPSEKWQSHDSRTCASRGHVTKSHCQRGKHDSCFSLGINIFFPRLLEGDEVDHSCLRSLFIHTLIFHSPLSSVIRLAIAQAFVMRLPRLMWGSCHPAMIYYSSELVGWSVYARAQGHPGSRPYLPLQRALLCLLHTRPLWPGPVRSTHTSWISASLPKLCRLLSQCQSPSPLLLGIPHFRFNLQNWAALRNLQQCYVTLI